MSNSDNNQSLSKAWIALRRLDLNGGTVAALREVEIPRGAEASAVRQILSNAFGLDSANLAFKMRNHQGRLVPLNSSVPVNSKHMPCVLEVSRVFQHVTPEPRSVPMTMINKNMKSRLQNVVRRTERLEELLPQINLRRHDKLNQEVDLLNQKLRFLHQRMQEADAQRWRGVLARAPLW